MVPPLFSARRRGGFTLIELLVVITIVGILAAILFPVFGSVQNSGRKTQAVSDERNLCVAVMAYKTDYNHLPLTPNQVGGAQANYDTVYGDPGKNTLYKGYLLINCLRGINPSSGDTSYPSDYPPNPSGTMYFTAPYVKDRTDPRHGILLYDYTDTTPSTGYTMKKGSFVDPWGSEYIVWLDANNDHDFNVAMRWFYPTYPQDTDTTIYGPKGSVQVGSMGADETFGTKNNQVLDGSDDIITTQ